MESKNQLESMLAGWMRAIPHLPASARKWFAGNIWWMALTGINLSVIGIMALVGYIITVASFMNVMSSSVLYGSYYTSPYNGWYFLMLLFVLAILVINIVLLALSVTPLQLLHKKGWNLLFKVLILNAITMIIGAISTWTVFGFVVSIIVSAIVLFVHAYLLFEMRSHFNGATVVEKK